MTIVAGTPGRFFSRKLAGAKFVALAVAVNNPEIVFAVRIGAVKSPFVSVEPLAFAAKFPDTPDAGAEKFTEMPLYTVPLPISVALICRAVANAVLTVADWLLP